MDLNQIRARMQDAMVHLKSELAQIRTGRAAPTLVSDILVDAYNSKMMVKELGQITAPQPTVIMITPWDKSIITNIVGGIVKANLGLNPVVDGDLIRIVIPPLSSERRDQFIKQMHQTLEKYRVEIRQIRHEAVEDIKNKKQAAEISEDEQKRQIDQIQKLHDQFIEEIEVLGEAKEAELREV